MEIRSYLGQHAGWILLVALLVGVYLLRLVLVPFFLALTIAFLAMPLANWLDRWLPRAWSALLAFAVFFLGSIGFLTWLGMTLYKEGAQLITFLEDFVRRHDLSAIAPWLQRQNLNWSRLLSGGIAYLFQGLQAAAGVLFFLLGFLIIPVYSYYLLKDGRQHLEDIQSMLPNQNRDEIVRFFREVHHILKNFIYGQMTIAGLEGAIAAIGFLILGVPYAILLGTFVGLTSLIPFLGPPLGFIPAILVGWASSQNLVIPVGVGGIWILTQVLENYVFQPKIMGNRMRMHPLIVILSIIIWGSVFGFLGVLMATPITAVLQVVYLRLVKRQRFAAKPGS